VVSLTFFNGRVTGLDRWAKRFELNFFIKKTFFCLPGLVLLIKCFAYLGKTNLFPAKNLNETAAAFWNGVLRIVIK